VDLPTDLAPAIKLEADAIQRQRTAPDALVALPPVGVGTREGEVTKVFKDSFQSIVLDGADIRSTLDDQAKVMNGLLAELKVSCWSPDPAGSPCEVA
jgi:multiple sugar transport system substrate-binding protein